MSGWVLGWIIGAAVVLVVVALLLILIRGAAAAAGRAEAILAGLEEARDNTDALWKVADTVSVAHRIVASATAAREHLEGVRP